MNADVLRFVSKVFNMDKEKIDPVCLIHGKKMSEHVCLYCCLCFRSLTLEECNVRDDGKREDVCKECARKEQMYMSKKGTNNE